jgi:hypothetical protein
MAFNFAGVAMFVCSFNFAGVAMFVWRSADERRQVFVRQYTRATHTQKETGMQGKAAASVRDISN